MVVVNVACAMIGIGVGTMLTIYLSLPASARANQGVMPQHRYED